ncbi:MAG: hypothetical protein NT007_10800 [Candidatus Kapabacteria bacterium]|nr:hypothetical protein [Candidatus Kapabacteria bacterium]
MKSNFEIFTAIVFVLFFGLSSSDAYSQMKGVPESRKPFNEDSVFIFESPRTLISVQSKDNEIRNAYGLELLFSNNGFAGGFFFDKRLGKGFFAFADAFISNARNTDEIPAYDPYYYQYVPGKINSLIMIPLSFGLQKFILEDVLFENLKPYFEAGAGPTFIFAAPYDYKALLPNIFKGNSYTRLNTFLGFGVNMGSIANSFLGLNIRYYYIPFGGNGIESVIDHPIKDFGGIFLSLKLGTRF